MAIVEENVKLANKKPIIIWGMLAIFVLSLFACSNETTPSTSTTNTIILSATLSPTPTVSRTPTLTPLITPTRTPVSRTFFPQTPMNIDVSQFVELRRYGNGAVSSMQIRPDGQILALAGGVGIWLYERQSMTLLAHLDGEAGWVHQIDWSPNGIYLAAANDNGTVQVWDVEAREIIQVFHKHQEPVLAVDWAPDGERLVSGGQDNVARVWELGTGTEIKTSTGFNGSECGSCRVTNGLAWSPDGESIAVITNRIVRIWKLYQSNTFNIYSSWAVYEIEWSPDGKSLAIGSNEGGMIADAENWEEIIRFGDYQARGISWSPEGDKIAVLTPNGSQWMEFVNTYRVVVWDFAIERSSDIVIETFPKLIASDMGQGFINDIDWTSDGEQVVLSGNGIVWFWDTSAHLIRHSLYEYFGESNIDLSPDGQQLVTSNGRLLTLFPDNEEWKYLGVNRRKVSWSPDGEKIAFRERLGLRILDTEDNSIRWYLDENGRDLDLIDSLDFSWAPNGNQIAVKQVVNYNDAQVELWALPENDKFGELVHIQTFPLIAYGFLIDDIIWSPDGTLLAFRGDYELNVFDVANNQLIKSIGTHEYCHHKTWSHTGKYIALSCDLNMVRIVDTENWQENQAFSVSISIDWSTISSIDWSPDDRYLLVAYYNGLISIWGAESGQLISTLEGHTDSVQRAIWSPKGNSIVSVSKDGTIRIWGLPKD